MIRRLGNSCGGLLVRTCSNLKKRVTLTTFNVVTIGVGGTITLGLNSMGIPAPISYALGIGAGAVAGTIASELVTFIGNGVQTVLEANLTPPPDVQSDGAQSDAKARTENLCERMLRLRNEAEKKYSGDPQNVLKNRATIFADSAMLFEQNKSSANYKRFFDAYMMERTEQGRNVLETHLITKSAGRRFPKS